MSRCFPYPPPGYVKKVAHDEAQIESIKLQREKEKIKKDRKKEKKREKKEKKKALEDGKSENKKHSHKRRRVDEGRIEDKKGRGNQKKIENEVEQLEKSCVTEEHGNPVGSQNSLDSTINSNKRLKQSSPQDGKHNSGSVLWIRLPSQRQKDPEVLPSKKQPSSATGMLEPPPAMTSRELGKQSCPTSRNVGTVSVSKEVACPSIVARKVSACEVGTSPDMLCRSCPPALASKLRDLVEEWIPQPVQLKLVDSGDQDWLSGSKRHNKCGRKSSKVGSDGSSTENFTSWPRACYLPEAGIYALPFTIPF